MPAIYYPPADRTTQWWEDDFDRTTMPGIDKLLSHTTETGSWPGYSGGGSAPTLTYHPRLHRWRQHCKLNRSARALRDPSGTAVRENRDSVVQVEIICSCDRAFADRYSYQHVTELDAQAIDDLGEFWAFLHREWGTPLVNAPLWLPYPQSYGDSAARMTGPEYDAFRGHCGHQHASGNTHGDPGALNVAAILATARRHVGIPVPPPPTPLPKDWFTMATIEDLRTAIRAELPDLLNTIVRTVDDQPQSVRLALADMLWLAGRLGSAGDLTATLNQIRNQTISNGKLVVSVSNNLVALMQRIAAEDVADDAEVAKIHQLAEELKAAATAVQVDITALREAHATPPPPPNP